MKNMIVTNDNQWKAVAFRNNSFHSLLICLVQEGNIQKGSFPFCLNLEAKYELIRMESLELLKFNDGQLELGKNGEGVIDFCTEKKLGIAV
tara:strand:- start:938 stop:1210 length:273 start_codon:yes stop_codon:yes gene_type:complete